MIDRMMLGVKLPDLGSSVGVADGLAVGVMVLTGVALGDAVDEGFGVGVLVRVGVGVVVTFGVADGVATNAGSSPACTTKLLVRVLFIPDVSIQDKVIVWAPGSRFDGGLQLHEPFEPTVALPDKTVSEWMEIVTSVPFGPSPKNSGFSLVIISPSVILSSVISFEVGTGVPVILNLDSWVAFSGKVKSAFGFWLVVFGGKLLKS